MIYLQLMSSGRMAIVKSVEAIELIMSRMSINPRMWGEVSPMAQIVLDMYEGVCILRDGNYSINQTPVSQTPKIASQLAELTYKFACERSVCVLNTDARCSDGSCENCIMDIIVRTNDFSTASKIRLYRKDEGIDTWLKRPGSRVNMNLCKLAALNGNALAVLQICVEAVLSTTYANNFGSNPNFNHLQKINPNTMGLYLPIIIAAGMNKSVVELGKWCYYHASGRFTSRNCELAITILQAVPEKDEVVHTYLSKAYADSCCRQNRYKYMFLAAKHAAAAGKLCLAGECVMKILQFDKLTVELIEFISEHELHKYTDDDIMGVIVEIRNLYINKQRMRTYTRKTKDLFFAKIEFRMIYLQLISPKRMSGKIFQANQRIMAMYNAISFLYGPVHYDNYLIDRTPVSQTPASQTPKIASQLAEITYKFARERSVCVLKTDARCSDGSCENCIMNIIDRTITDVQYCAETYINKWQKRPESRVNMDLCKLAALNGNPLAALQVCVKAVLPAIKVFEYYIYDRFVPVQKRISNTLGLYLPIIIAANMNKSAVKLGKWCYYFASNDVDNRDCGLTITILQAVSEKDKVVHSYLASSYSQQRHRRSGNYMFLAAKHFVLAGNLRSAVECVKRILTHDKITVELIDFIIEHKLHKHANDNLLNAIVMTRGLYINK